MRRNLVVLLLLFFCLAFPFLTIWLGDQEQAKLQAYENLESAKSNVLSHLDQIALEHNHEAQMTKLCELFWDSIQSTASSAPDFNRIAQCYNNLFRPLLPTHDFVFLDLQQSATVFKTDSLHEFTEIYSDFIQIASESTASDKKISSIIKIKNSLQVCLPASVQAEWHGKWQVLRGITRTRILYWTVFANQYFLAVYLDADGLADDFIAKTQALTWNSKDTGLIFLSVGNEKVISSSYFSEHPEFIDMLKDAANLQFSQINQGFSATSDLIKRPGFVFTSTKDMAIGGAPDYLSPFYRAYLIENLNSKRLLSKNFGFFKYSIFLLLFVFWFHQLVRQLRNPDCREFSVRFLLLVTFLACSILPLSCVKFLSGKFLIERYKNEKFSLSDELHNSLKAIDENGRHNLASHTSYIKSLNSVEKFEKVANQQFSKETMNTFFTRSLKTLGEQKLLFMHIFLCIASNGNYTHLTGLFGNMSENTQKDFLVSRIIRNTRKRFEPFQHSEKKEIQPPDLKNQLDMGGLEKEMVDEVFLRLIGPNTFIDLFHYPERLFEISLLFTSTYILESKIWSGKDLFLTYWFWNGRYLEGSYLQKSLPALPCDASEMSTKDLTVGLIGFRNETDLYPAEFSSQKDGCSDLYSLMINSHLNRLSVRTEGISNGEKLLYEAMPARNIKAVLAGQRSLTDLENKKVQNERLEIYILVALLAFALGIGLVCGMYFIIPLQQIIKAIKEIKNGNSGVRIDDTRHDEFGSLGLAFNQMAKGLEEGSVLRRFVSKSARHAARSDQQSDTTCSGESITATVLFSCIKGFQQFQSNNESSEVFSVMNRHLEIADAAVEAFGGEIDKIIGDKIMLVFRHKELGGDSAAVSKALKVIRRMNELAFQQSFELKLAIGLNSGKVVSGVIGTSHGRLDFTVIGDPVNLAARLASLAEKSDGNSVLVSSATQKFVVDKSCLTKSGTVRVKGKNQEVEIFSCHL